MEISAKTQEVAQKIYDMILMNPERHSQSTWIGQETSLYVPKSEEDFCGTTMCIAGHAIFLESGLEGLRRISEGYGSEGFSTAGARIMNLDVDDANELFFTMEDSVALSALLALANGDGEKFKELLGE